MKKIKLKAVVSMLLIFTILFSNFSWLSIYAYSATSSLTSDSTVLETGKTYTLTLKINPTDVGTTEGIDSMQGSIKFETDVFNVSEDDYFNATKKWQAPSIQTITYENGFTIISFISDTKSNKKYNTETEVFTITLTTKDSVDVNSTTISIDSSGIFDYSVSGGKTQAGGTGDIYLDPVSVTLKKATQDPEPTPATSAIVSKFKKDTTTLLDGATIALYKTAENAQAGESALAELTTGTDGQDTGKVDFAKATSLTTGTYFYKETKAPDGYVTNDTIYSFSVDSEGNVTYNSPNTKGIIEDEEETVAPTPATSAIIVKQDKESKAVLNGATIALYDTKTKAETGSEENALAVLTTGENGQVDFAKSTSLTTGTYFYKETKAPDGYDVNNTVYSFSVNSEGKVTYNSPNTEGIIYDTETAPTPATSVIVTKRIKDTTTPLAGAKIALVDEFGNILKTESKKSAVLTTGENGQVNLATLLDLTKGTHFYKEVAAPTGYKADTEVYSFDVDKAGNVTFNAPNTKGIIEDEAITANSVIITKYKTDTYDVVEGATIALYKTAENAKAGENALAKLTTDENGQVDFASRATLETGKTYYYKETAAPLGYVKNDKVYSFTINADSTVTFDEANGILYNDRISAGDETVVIQKVKSSDATPLQGAKIALYSSRDDATNKDTTNEDKAIIELTTDENGKAYFSRETTLEPGTYFYKETVAPTGYSLNTNIYSFKVNEDGTVTFEDKANNGTIYDDRITAQEGTAVITKYKTDTETPVQGAEIALYDSEHSAIQKDGKDVVLTTDENGQIDFSKAVGLEPGTYYYKETKAPLGYKLNETEYSFTVSEEGTVTFDSAEGKLYDERVIAGEDSVIVTKLRRSLETPLQGAEITLYDSEHKIMKDKDGNDAVLTTDENGNAIFSKVVKLEPGTYYFKETKAPTGYSLNETEYTFTVNNDASVDFDNANGIIYDDRITAQEGTAVITKYKTNTETPLQGAKIALYDSEHNAMKDKDEKEIVLTTDEKGQVDFSKVVGLEPGTYYYKEVQAPKTYVLNETEYSFTVSEEGTVTFDSAEGKLYNDRATAEEGTAIVTKLRKNTETPLQGAEITLYDSEREIMKDKDGNDVVLTTDEKGQVDFSKALGLEPGTYYYKETKAPLGYKLNETEYSFTVSEDCVVEFGASNGKIYDDRITAQEGTAVITKYKKGTTIAVPGAEITLYNSENKVMKYANGEDIVLKTDAKGKADFSKATALEPGTYFYKETKAPETYIKNDTKYSFTVSEEGKVTFDSANSILYNDRITAKEGTVVITKYKKGTETVLKGAEITLYDSEHKVMKDKNGKDVILTTDEKGQADFSKAVGLEPGTYYYKETKAPFGYKVNETEFSFTIQNDVTVKFDENNGKIYDSRMTAKPGTVTITKYVTGTTTPIAGAQIVLCDSKGTILKADDKELKLTTDSKGKVDFTTIVNLEPGTYYYKETKTPTGYKLDTKLYSFNVNEDGTVTFDSANSILYNSKDETKPPKEAGAGEETKDNTKEETKTEGRTETKDETNTIPTKETKPDKLPYAGIEPIHVGIGAAIIQLIGSAVLLFKRFI